jgi:hypothetical protein
MPATGAEFEEEPGRSGALEAANLLPDVHTMCLHQAGMSTWLESGESIHGKSRCS